VGKRVVVSAPGKCTRVARRDLAETRRKVIGAIDKGFSPEEASEIFDCGRSTVYGWLAAYRAQGEDSFEVKKPSGRPPLLTKRQTNQLRKWIVGKDPRQLRFEFALWTREIVRDLIAERYGVEMTLQGVGVLLRRLGLSAQRPLVRAYEQDPERVRRFKEEEYPAIARRAKKLGATIFFGDEAGIRSDYHTGTTWGEVGHTPVVRGTGQRKSLNMISAVSAKGKLHFTFVEGKVNADAFIGYLKKLLHDVKGTIFLIVDGHPSHKASKVKQFVAETRGRLELYLLPPYSPELNPDE
jgi:transposase